MSYSASPLPLAVTIGDPAGVGPEIVVRSIAAGELDCDDLVIYGDLAVLRRCASMLGVTLDWDALAIDDPGMLEPADVVVGEVRRATGAAALAYVERATRDALAGRLAGLVTLPINKEATQLSSPGFVGHTEFIAELCGRSNVTMMLVADQLAVTHVSTHCSLREAIERVTTERVLDVIRLTDDTLRRMLPTPRIAVCGLNPHAGEHGLFGDEDANHIAPAVAAARDLGIEAHGPLPADTVFHLALHRHRYDAIVCMYHDQGHAPMKLLAFETGVNVTVGLPIIRTSVDHGTAFDIAWQGVAVTRSLDAAVAYARRLRDGTA